MVFNLLNSNILLEKDFAVLFGIEVGELGEDLQALITRFNSLYRHLDAKEIQDVILKILKKIDSPDLGIAGVNHKERWVRDWQENLDNFIKSGHNVRKLIPKYIRPNHPVRLFGDYAMPSDPKFELHFYEIYRRWLFRSYLADAESVSRYVLSEASLTVSNSIIINLLCQTCYNFRYL